MAIIFFKKLNDVCCAYKENVVKFKSVADYAVIGIYTKNGFFTLKKIFSYENRFYFNFKESFKLCFKEQNHPIFYKTGEVQDYQGVSLGAMVTFNTFKKVNNKADERVDSYRKSLFILKSAVKGNDFLSVMHASADDECHLTIWRGYPMDIALFSKDNYLPSTLASDLPTPKQGLKTQLYCLTDGTLVVPENQFTWGRTKIFTYLKDECGIYLKWLNRYGGWDYHLFTNYTEKYKNKDIFKIQEYNQEVTTGKIVTEQIELLAGAVSGLELEKIRGILYSSHVYLYMGKKGQKANHNDWQLVRLDGSVEINNLTHSHNFKFTINLPSKNTITL